MAEPINDELERLYPIALNFLMEAVRGARDAMLSYTQFCEHVGLDVRDAAQRAFLMSPLLGLVSEREHAAGRPLLSAIVYGRKNNEPGPGFDDLRKRLGMNKPRDITEFWMTELNRVHQYWQSH